MGACCLSHAAQGDLSQQPQGTDLQIDCPPAHLASLLLHLSAQKEVRTRILILLPHFFSFSISVEAQAPNPRIALILIHHHQSLDNYFHISLQNTIDSDLSPPPPGRLQLLLLRLTSAFLTLRSVLNTPASVILLKFMLSVSAFSSTFFVTSQSE